MWSWRMHLIALTQVDPPREVRNRGKNDRRQDPQRYDVPQKLGNDIDRGAVALRVAIADVNQALLSPHADNAHRHHKEKRQHEEEEADAGEESRCQWHENGGAPRARGACFVWWLPGQRRLVAEQDHTCWH